MKSSMLRLGLSLLPLAIQSQSCLDSASTTCVASDAVVTNDCIDTALDQSGSTVHPFRCAQCTTVDGPCAATDTADCEVDNPRLCAICQSDLRCLSQVSECPDESEGESVECFECPSSGCCVTKDRFSTKCSEINDWGNSFFCSDAQQCVPCEDQQTGSNADDDIDDGCSSSNPYCAVDASDARDNKCVECEAPADCLRQSAFSGFDVDCLSCTAGVCGQDADETDCTGTNTAGNAYICANDDDNADHAADDGQCVPCIDDADSQGTDAACDAEKPYCVGEGDSRECVECEAPADCLRQSAFSGFDVVCLSCTAGVCGQDADGESCAPPENAAGNDYFCVNNDGASEDDGKCVACVDDQEAILAVDQGCSASLSHCEDGDCVECRNDEDCEGNCGVCTDNVCVPSDDLCGCGTCEGSAASSEYFPDHNYNCVGGDTQGCKTCTCGATPPCTFGAQSCSAVAGRPLACPCQTEDDCCGGPEGIVACANGFCTACGCLDDGGQNCNLQCNALELGVCEYCEVNPAGNNCRPKDSKNCGQFCGGNEANLDPSDRATNCAIHRACVAFGLDLDVYPIDPTCP